MEPFGSRDETNRSELLTGKNKRRAATLQGTPPAAGQATAKRTRSTYDKSLPNSDLHNLADFIKEFGSALRQASLRSDRGEGMPAFERPATRIENRVRHRGALGGANFDASRLIRCAISRHLLRNAMCADCLVDLS